MKRVAYIMEYSRGSQFDESLSFQVINASTGRHVSPLFSTLLEAIEFFDHILDYEWNGHIEVRGSRPASGA